MKKKFFLFGFLVALVVVGLFIFGFVLYIKDQQQTALAKEFTKETIDVEISILKFEKQEIEGLEFIDLRKNKKIDNFEKRFLFVNFWATWCAPCIAEMPQLEKLTSDPEIKKLPIQFIFTSDEENKKITTFFEKKKFDLIFTKTSNELPAIISLQTIPATYIFDSQANIVFKIVGMQSWNSNLIKSFLKSLN